MTLAEKLRFLADRAEDGKEFYLGDVALRFDSETRDMIMKNHDGVWFYSNINVNTIENHDVKLKPQWEFTEDEKAILRNIPLMYQYIVRDEHDDTLTIYKYIPSKSVESSVWRFGGVSHTLPFKNIFKSIKWTDEKPCDFRKYL